MLAAMERGSLCAFGRAVPPVVRSIERVYGDGAVRVSRRRRRRDRPGGLAAARRRARRRGRGPGALRGPPARPRTAPAGRAWSSIEGGEGPVPACTTPVAEGASVRTDDPVALQTARLALELIVGQLPERALDQPPERSELVRACRRLGVERSRFRGEREGERDDSHPYVKYDPKLCIACARCVRMCDEVQGTFALAMVGPRRRHRARARLGRPLERVGLRLVRRLRGQLPFRGAVGAGPARPAAARAQDDDHVRLLRRRLHARRPHPRR